MQKVTWKFWNNYEWIGNNIPFFLYCTFLGVLFIANDHWGSKMIRRVNKLAAEVKDLNYETKVLKGALLFVNKQSQLQNAVSSMELEISKDNVILVTDSMIINK
jgi:hypothetical protein